MLDYKNGSFYGECTYNVSSMCVEVCEIPPLGKSLSVRLACFLLILYIVSIKPYSKTVLVYSLRT